MKEKKNRYVIHGRPFCFVVFAVVGYNRMIRNENEETKQNKKQNKIARKVHLII